MINLSKPAIWLGGALLVLPMAARADLQIFPDDVANPLTPVVAPVAGGAEKNALNVAATFTYPLGKALDFSKGGVASVALRGGGDRQPQTLLALREGDRVLSVTTAHAEQKKVLTLVWKEGEKAAKSVATDVTLGAGWQNVELRWDGVGATLSVGEKRLSLAGVGAFAPSRVGVLASRVDELSIRGGGEFRLDWENGYAASLLPAPGAREVTLRPLGFDAYFVSGQPGRRDTPSLQLHNASGEAFNGTVRFSMLSENGGKTVNWTQAVSAPARSSTRADIAFPVALTPDIYHLRMESEGALALAQTLHFVFAGRRAGVAGPSKFGFHDSNRDTFGFWPDALPVDMAHHYVRWGYVVGPAWIKDGQGTYGISPDTPSSEWFWNSRLDWSVDQGLIPLVCIGGEPMLDWMREQKYAPERMKKNDWGEIGGKPNIARYRQFVRELATRYKGRVRAYEIQNEPNSYPPGGWEPTDYVAILQAAYEEIHAIDPQAKIYGISGTGDFVPWMTKVFELGGAKFMDGVSIHTYTTPKLPDADLPAKLKQVRALIAKHNQHLTLLNSETGTYVAPREEAERMIAPARLTELIQKGESPTLTVAKGWPNYALDEVTGSLSIVRNATYNLAAGAEKFVFFGWNPKWPNADWWTRRDYGGWGMISATRDAKERTPNLYALAIGVYAVQMEAVVPQSGAPIEQANVRGAIFRTAGGGSTAVVWSTAGTRTAVFEVQGSGPSAVSLFGQSTSLRASADRVRLELSEQPTYLHLEKGTLQIQASPFGGAQVVRSGNGSYGVQYTLTNRGRADWKGRVDYRQPAGWKIEPVASSFDLKPGQSAALSFSVIPPANSNGTKAVIGTVQTPEGDASTISLPVKVRPTTQVPFQASEGPQSFEAIQAPVLAMNRPEQVVVGRPPALSSLQEARYWQGPDELSAQVKMSYSQTGMTVAVRVHDANFRQPNPWPGVAGSAVELFFDTRGANAGLGTAAYGPGVHQFVLKPPAKEGEAVTVWAAKGGEIAGVKATGRKIGDKDYEVSFFLPWPAVGVNAQAGTQLGVDVSVDGATPTATGRKSQIALFGTSNNASDASDLGHMVLGP